MVNNQENVNNKLCEDVYKYVKDMAMAGSCNCYYHFDYRGISVEELHNTMLYLYDKGFNPDFDVCAHLYVDWSKATRGEALELKAIAEKARKPIWEIEKKLYKKKFVAVSSDNPFYENIKKSLEIDELDGTCKLSYVNIDDKEFLLAVEVPTLFPEINK